MAMRVELFTSCVYGEDFTGIENIGLGGSLPLPPSAEWLINALPGCTKATGRFSTSPWIRAALTVISRRVGTYKLQCASLAAGAYYKTRPALNGDPDDVSLQFAGYGVWTSPAQASPSRSSSHPRQTHLPIAVYAPPSLPTTCVWQALAAMPPLASWPRPQWEPRNGSGELQLPSHDFVKRNDCELMIVRSPVPLLRLTLSMQIGSVGPGPAESSVYESSDFVRIELAAPPAGDPFRYEPPYNNAAERVREFTKFFTNMVGLAYHR